VNARYDAFLNQLFASRGIEPDEAAELLAFRPGFVWLDEPPAPERLGEPSHAGPVFSTMHGMTATTAAPVAAPSAAAEIVEVRARGDLDAWHGVYCEVFGVDPRGRDDWHALHHALGPAGDRSLLLLLARVEGAPAATGGVFLHEGWAGLYLFTTRAAMRGRGLGSALVCAAHDAARARGIERALLHATAMGRPVYARAGYREERLLPLLISR
jgi:GNAT superfamily N-acetyltransferase